MKNITHITYLFDPLCGWCYGASARIAELAAKPEFTVRLMPTGLFATPDAPRMDEQFAAYAWANDQRIAQLTGEVFSEDYRTRVLADRSARLNSAPATLALTAVAMTDPAQELKALRLIQTARYVKGLDVTDAKELVRLLNTAGLTEAAALLASPAESLLAANRERVGTARRMMQRFQTNGVPAMVIGQDDTAQLFAAQQIFAGGDLAARLSAAAVLAQSDAR